MKLKRSTTIPLILLVYLIAMSIYGWPLRNPHITFTQYWITIGITLVCIVALSYTMKKRDEYRGRNNTGNKK